MKHKYCLTTMGKYSSSYYFSSKVAMNKWIKTELPVLEKDYGCNLPYFINNI